MKLVGIPKLKKLLEESSETRSWVKVWVSEITKMNWKSDTDIQKKYPKAIRVNEGLFIFTPYKSSCVIEVSLVYLQGVALVKAVRKA